MTQPSRPTLFVSDLDGTLLRDDRTLSDFRVVAFGDDVNDIAMIALADTGVAVANAHPDVKRAADRVIDSNEQDWVAQYIAREFGRSCELDLP